MLKAFLALTAVGALTLFSLGGVQQGLRDVRHALTDLAYPAIRDMRRSVVINPQKTVHRAPDEASVPVTGKEFVTDRDVLAATLVNPTAEADMDSSIARGIRKYQKACVPCHGKTLLGDGPVAAQFMPPPDLLAQATRERKDGYLYSYIRHGGVVMPAYGAAVTQQEAWDLINYIRQQQKANPR
jgi:mono/diheme cytochrome c family protein